MADSSFDVLGFIRDIGQRQRAKKIVSENQELLATGNPDSFRQIIARDPGNPHLAQQIQSVFQTMVPASALNFQGAQTAGEVERTAGNAQNRKQQETVFGQSQEARGQIKGFINPVLGGQNMSPEAVQGALGMLQQFANLGQTEAIVGQTRAQTRHLTEGQTPLVQAQTQNVLGENRRADASQNRLFSAEDTFARLMGAEGAGPFAAQVGAERRGQRALDLEGARDAETARYNVDRMKLANREAATNEMGTRAKLLSDLVGQGQYGFSSESASLANALVNLVSPGDSTLSPFRSRDAAQQQAETEAAKRALDSKLKGKTDGTPTPTPSAPQQPSAQPGGAMNPQNPWVPKTNATFDQPFQPSPQGGFKPFGPFGPNFGGTDPRVEKMANEMSGGQEALKQRIIQQLAEGKLTLQQILDEAMNIRYPKYSRD